MKSDARLLSFLLWLVAAYAGLWYGNLWYPPAMGWIAAAFVLVTGYLIERTPVEQRSNRSHLLNWFLFLLIWIPSFFTFSMVFSLAFGALLGLYYFMHRETYRQLWSKK